MRQNYLRKTLQEILDQFQDIGTIRKEFLFTSGFENSNYYVKTEVGNFVVKVFEALDVMPDCIFFEIEVMDRLSRFGIKIPEVHRAKNGNLYASMGEKYAILMNYVEGDNMEKHIISDALALQIGEQAGKMDFVLGMSKDASRTRQNYEFDLKNFLILESKLENLDSKFDRKIFLDIFHSFRKIKSSLDSSSSGLIHNDIVLHNIIAKNDELAGIVDFSDLVFSPYIQNIAVVFSQCFFTYNWQPHQARIFLNGYRKFHSLPENELAFLWTLTSARFATLIIELTYWNIMFGKDSQRTEFINDNYDFLKRFLTIGEKEFQKLIS